MRLYRRDLLRLAASAVALPAMGRVALADDYPSRPVHLIVGYGPGAAPDIYARLAADWLSRRLNQSFVIENKPGAGTNLATEAVARADPDGYTLLLVVAPNFINATLYSHLNFNFLHDIAPIASIAQVPFIMLVPPTFPARTVPEFIAYAKANPGKINMASGGTGTLTHFAGELFRMLTGVDMVHVPYRTDPLAMTDMISGRADVIFDPVAACIEHIKTGRLRALAVTTKERIALLPDLPPVADFVPGYEVAGWAGLGAPRGTPEPVIARLNKEMNAGLADAELNKKLLDIGSISVALSPDAYGKVFVSETEKWAKVIQFAGIKAE